MLIHDVEQGTEEWHRLRAGIPTASEFSKLVTSQAVVSASLEDYALTLACETYAGKIVDGFEGNKYTERGKQLEPLAIADYELTHQVDVQRVGFCTDRYMKYGCSPDGLVGDKGGLEIKCKIGKEHLKALMYYDQYRKVPPQYYAQPQGSMFVTGRKWWDLFFYHPDLPTLTIRLYPDRAFFKVLKAQLEEVALQRDIALDFLRNQ